MKPTKLSEIARLCGGKLVAGDPELTISNVCTDTRAMPEGALFVALSGERFDAHDFLTNAAEQAAACIVSRLPEDTDSLPAALILVEDTLVALQELARGYREQLNVVAVCVTGSNGKTSTKDFLNAVLGQQFNVNATAGNFNNHIGLPLTILRTEAHHTCGVWEIGMSNPGEIEPLAAIARPDVAVITNVGTAHIEFMKSREAIALEKGMLVEAVTAEGSVVLNATDEFTPSLTARAKGKVILAGIESGAVRAENLVARSDGTAFDVVYEKGVFGVDLPVPGRHMVANATLAIAVGIQLGVATQVIASGLANAAITGGRLQFREVNSLSFIDDSYNANPDSMRAALATLQTIDCKGLRVAVLGRMAELGAGSAAAHFNLGQDAAADFQVDVILTVGDEAAEIARGFTAAGGKQAYSCATHDECRTKLEVFTSNDLILVKGSRSSAMEKVIPKTQES
ncbi:MAG: UDP-N-acetylmuramoyl-tripeptide--D-alanyl-D-alanine ligase [Verrucomicrobiales bacterium]|jgi:UDP-N-acetylmuramoyl-tripeptide--D-alanyl-D-alanine ligase